MTNEETRAAEYRETLRRRVVNEAGNRVRLQGSRSARQALETAWSPIRDWLREREVIR